MAGHVSGRLEGAIAYRGVCFEEPAPPQAVFVLLEHLVEAFVVLDGVMSDLAIARDEAGFTVT